MISFYSNNIIEDNKIGIDGDVSDIRLTLRNNTIISNKRGGAICNGVNVNIEDNLIANNHNFGIEIIGDDSFIIYIRDNTIAYNELGLILNNFMEGASNTQCNYNNIYSNSQYNIKYYGKKQSKINVTSNWWGSVNSSIIEKKIFDYYDDFNLGEVDYFPYLNKPNPKATNPVYNNILNDWTNQPDDLFEGNDFDTIKNSSGKNKTISIKQVTLTLATIILITIISCFIVATEIGKYALFSTLTPLYNKTRKKRDSKFEYNKGSIRGYIIGNPGKSYSTIKKVLELSNGTLSYHIKILEQNGVIKSERDGLHRRFYPANVTLGEAVFDLTDIQQKIYETIEKFPGISQQGVATELDISQQKVNYNIQQMFKARLIGLERDGKRTNCFIIEEEF